MGWHAIFLSAAALISCGEYPATARPFSLVFVVESDPGIRLEGVRIFANGTPMGETDSDGLVRARIRSRVGQPLRVEHDCPDGHEEPSRPKALRLWQFEGIDPSASRGMEITLRCRPTIRLAAFIVRAKNGPHLPVLLDGEKVTQTNASGIAHFSARAAAGTEYTIQLDTREQPRLRPKSPMHLFILPNADEIFVVNQTFDLENEPARPGRPRARIIKIE
jgi:hypothetical protein